MTGVFTLSQGNTSLLVADPLAREPYYRGTRFDRSGIILSLDCGGHGYVRPWFRNYDPFMHDAVSGPSEEFTQIGYDEARPGGEFLKIGVGILKRDALPYDRFRLYEVADKGKVEVEREASRAFFRQRLEGVYDYVKEVELVGENTLLIRHSLLDSGTDTLDFQVYSHNFFILDGAQTGRDTVFSFPFRPSGNWRSPYDCVRLTENGIAFDRDLAPSESVFMGDLVSSAPLAAPGLPPEPFSFILSNKSNGLSVLGACDRAMDHAVFWSNREVSCIEPYIPFSIRPGDRAEWTLSYTFRF